MQATHVTRRRAVPPPPFCRISSCDSKTPRQPRLPIFVSNQTHPYPSHHTHSVSARFSNGRGPTLPISYAIASPMESTVPLRQVTSSNNSSIRLEAQRILIRLSIRADRPSTILYGLRTNGTILAS